MKLKLQSFTLIEALLVTSLIALVGVAILHSFANGLKLWAKAERVSRQAEVAIFLDKMAEDLKSVFVISGINFKGLSSQMSFPAIVMTEADQKSSRASEGIIDQMGAVQYRLASESHTIFRRQANYAQALKGKWSQKELPVVSGIDELDFYYETASAKGFLLKSEINEEIPLGVMVEVHFSDDSGQHQLKRYLSIPVGG